MSANRNAVPEENPDPFHFVNHKSSMESQDMDIFKVNGLVGTTSWILYLRCLTFMS
jgi:hypothetical protein